MYGETHNHAGQNETECFKRAVAQWKYCGSHHNEQVAAIYGPTGDLALPICDECSFPSFSFLDESIFIFRGSRDNFSILFHISMKIVSAKRIAPDGMPRFAISIVSDSRDLKRIRLSGACCCFKLRHRHSLSQGISISTSSVDNSYSCCLVLSIALHVLMTSKGVL